MMQQVLCEACSLLKINRFGNGNDCRLMALFALHTAVSIQIITLMQ